jgi:hypothetical protein
MDVRDRPERAFSSARITGSLFAALPAMPDDTLVTSRTADVPVMDERLGGTEVPYASSERWMLLVEQTDLRQERCSQRSSVAESERAGESPRKAL